MSCDLDWGGGVLVGNGPSEYLCAGDSALGSSDTPVLEYGTGYDIGPFRCVSQAAGVSCTNRRTGHGFRLSRQTARLF